MVRTSDDGLRQNEQAIAGPGAAGPEAAAVAPDAGAAGSEAAAAATLGAGAGSPAGVAVTVVVPFRWRPVSGGA